MNSKLKMDTTSPSPALVAAAVDDEYDGEEVNADDGPKKKKRKSKSSKNKEKLQALEDENARNNLMRSLIDGKDLSSSSANVFIKAHIKDAGGAPAGGAAAADRKPDIFLAKPGGGEVKSCSIGNNKNDNNNGFNLKEIGSKKLRKNKIRLINQEIAELAQKKKLKDAEKKFIWCIRNPNDVDVDVHTCTALMNCYSRCQDTEKMIELLHFMNYRSILPNQVTLTTLLKGFCENCEIEKAYHVLNVLFPSYQVLPNIRTFSTFLRGCVRVGAVNFMIEVDRKYHVVDAFSAILSSESTNSSNNGNNNSNCSNSNSNSNADFDTNGVSTVGIFAFFENFVQLLCQKNEEELSLKISSSLISLYTDSAVRVKRGADEDLLSYMLGISISLSKMYVIQGKLQGAQIWLAHGDQFLREKSSSKTGNSSNKKLSSLDNNRKRGFDDVSPAGSSLVSSESTSLFIRHRFDELVSEFHTIKDYFGLLLNDLPRSTAATVASASGGGYGVGILSQSSRLSPVALMFSEVLQVLRLFDMYSRVVYIGNFSKLNEKNVSACIFDSLVESFGVSNIFLKYSNCLCAKSSDEQPGSIDFCFDDGKTDEKSKNILNNIVSKIYDHLLSLFVLAKDALLVDKIKSCYMGDKDESTGLYSDQGVSFKLLFTSLYYCKLDDNEVEEEEEKAGTSANNPVFYDNKNLKKTARKLLKLASKLKSQCGSNESAIFISQCVSKFLDTYVFFRRHEDEAPVTRPSSSKSSSKSGIVMESSSSLDVIENHDERVMVELGSGNGDWVSSQCRYSAGVRDNMKWISMELRCDRVYEIMCNSVFVSSRMPSKTLNTPSSNSSFASGGVVGSSSSSSSNSSSSAVTEVTRSADFLTNIAFYGGDATAYLAPTRVVNDSEVKNNLFFQNDSISHFVSNFPEPPERNSSIESCKEGVHLLTNTFLHYCLDRMLVPSHSLPGNHAAVDSLVGKFTIYSDNLQYIVSIGSEIAKVAAYKLSSISSSSSHPKGYSSSSSNIFYNNIDNNSEDFIFLSSQLIAKGKHGNVRMIQQVFPIKVNSNQGSNSSSSSSSSSNNSKNDVNSNTASGGGANSSGAVIQIWRGDPDGLDGHFVNCSSYFDRLWSNGSKTKRYFLTLKKASMK